MPLYHTKLVHRRLPDCELNAAYKKNTMLCYIKLDEGQDESQAWPMIYEIKIN